MLMKKLGFFGLLLAMFLWLCASVACAEPIGKVLAMRGKATATSTDGSDRTLEIGSEISIADVIKTGRRCRMQIIFADSTIVSLGPVSDFVVEDYSWDEQTREGRMASKVNEGVFRVLGGSITKTSPQNFTTETPSATIGIRGSMYAGRVRDGQLAVVFQGGRGIFVRNPLGSVEISTPGYGTRLEAPGAPPQQPYPVSADELNQLDPATAPPPPLVGDADGEDAAGPAVVEGEGGAAEEPVAAEEPTDEGAVEVVVEDAAPTELPLEVDAPAQDTLTDTVLADNSSTTPTGGTAILSGQYLAVLQEDLNSANTDNQGWLSSITGLTSAGELTGTASGSPAPNIGPYTVTGYDPSLSYSGVIKHTISRTVPLLGTAISFSAEIINDNTGEFSVLNLVGSFNSPSYTFREIGFLGTPTLTLPTSGISWFSGPLAGTLSDVATVDFEGFGDMTDMVVNWHSKSVFGVVKAVAGNGGTGFYFGQVNATGTGFTITHFFGNDILDDDPAFGDILAIDGSGTGQFYGNQASGFGMVASGGTYLVQFSQPQQEDFLVTAAGFRDPTNTASLTGSTTLQGFVVGVGEDMANPSVGRQYFFSNGGTSLDLSINRDTGIITGNLSAKELSAPFGADRIANISVGGGNGSAYITDEIIAAGLGGTGVVNGNDLKTHGNYLISEDPDKGPLANYTSWGSWEIAYYDAADYHLHMPSSLWIAGEQTPTAAVDALISSNFTATYTGGAAGVQIPASGSMIELTGGSTNLLIDFNPMASTPVSGTISFSEVTLNVMSSSTDLTNSGFQGYLSPAATSFVNGAFFGPNAESIGGNFYGDFGGDQRYMGVFGGNR